MKAEAALTTTGRASTVRWRGSGKRDGKVYARNQRQKASQEKTTSLGIPVKVVTDSGAKLDTDSGQSGHRSKRSDAGG